MGLDVTNGLAVCGIVKGHGSELVRESRERGCLDIIEGLAVVVGVGGDIGGMKMSAEGEVHSRVGKSLGALHPIVEHEGIEQLVLYRHVRDKVVVSHAYDGLAVLLCLFALLESPLHKLGSEAAGGLLNIVALCGGICRIFAGIKHEKSVAALEPDCERETARLAARGSENILFFVRYKVAAEKGKRLVALARAVEGQVAGDEYIVALLGNSLFERRVDKGVDFVVLAVAPVVPCVVGFAESVFRIPCSFFGISKIVNVGDRGDSERALFLGKSTENSGRDGGKYERHADYNRDDAACQSSSVFHFVSSFF